MILQRQINWSKFFISALIFSWIFLGLPQIFNLPLGIQEAWADTVTYRFTAFTTQSKYQAIGISWRQWAGTWAVASQKGTGSGTDWEFWESNYASEETRTIHFTGSGGAMYLEDSTQDAQDPSG